MMSKYLKEDLRSLAEYLHEQNFGKTSIMVTGATGLVGSLIIKAIIEHNRIYDDNIRAIALARSSSKVKDVFSDNLSNLNHVEFIYQDITEPISVNCYCDYIIHTATPTVSKYFITNPVEVIDVVYTGSKRVLEFGLQQKVKGIVYLSSMEVFGTVNKSEKLVSEEDLGYLDLQNIRCCYSEGKRLVELLCKSYAVEYNLPVSIARLSQTFGAGIHKSENRVFAQFARSAIEQKDIVLHTNGLSYGNYCYTADTIRAIFVLLQNGVNGEVYNVVNEETTRTIKQMAQMVAEKFSDGKSKVIIDTANTESFGYAPKTVMRLSSRKLQSLGWKPTIDLEEMYTRMLPDLNREI